MPIADDFMVNDLVVKKANDLFTDREDPRRAFWDVYNSMVPGEYTAIGYYGIGGIGKSTLLKKLVSEIDEKIPESKGLDHIMYSFEDYTSKEVFLFQLSRQMKLRNKGLEFPLFDEAIAKICREGNRDIEKMKADVVESFSQNPLIGTALSFLGEFLPGVDPATRIAEKVVELTNNAVSAYERKHGKNAVLYNQIAYSDNKTLINDYLHEYFIFDVNAAMKKRTRPLVIFLDGYEKYVDILNNAELVTGKDNWIHYNWLRLVNIPNTLWVVAGREKMNWKEDVLPKEQLHRVGDLSEKDAMEYFEKAGVSDETLIPQLCKLCNGTPVYMDLCVKTYVEISKMREPVIDDFGKDTSELAQRYLTCMDKPTRRLLELIAWLPNVWTKNMVTDIVKMVNYDSYLPEMNIILSLSLIEPIELGYKLHETCRVVARKVCDNAELIQNAVINYLEERVVSPFNPKEKLYMLSQLFDVLPHADCVSLDEQELALLLDVFENELENSVTFYENAILADKIDAYITRCDVSAGIKVRSGWIKEETLVEAGQYKIANALAIQNYEYACSFLPEDSKEKLHIMSQLAFSYYSVGNYNEAKNVAKKCLEISTRVLGEEDAVTLGAASNLANAHAALGEYTDAKELRQKCYEIAKRLFGEEHPNTLGALHNLAVSYGLSKEDEVAKELTEKCYEMEKRVFGEEHPSTLSTLNSLVVCYTSLGEIERAEEIGEPCYEMHKRVLGETHPDTIRTLQNLTKVYFALHKFEKAKNLKRISYESRKNALGEEHPDTIVSLDDLAYTCGSLGDYQEEKTLREQAYEIKKRTLGEEHPDTIFALNNIAVACVFLEEENKALELTEICYETSKRTLGEEHRDTQHYASCLERLRRIVGK